LAATAPTRPSPVSTLPDILVWVVALAAGVSTIPLTVAPTGWVVTNELFTFAFAFVVVLAAARARPWTWVVLATVTAVAAEGTDYFAVGVAALVIALAAVGLNRAVPPVAAVVAALALQALLRLPEVAVTGGSAVVAGIAVLPVLLSAYRAAGPRTRRVVNWSIGVGVALAVLAAVGLAFAVLSAREDVNAGIRRAQRGFEAARSGEGRDAVGRFQRAADSFGTANDELNAPWAAAARAFPILGPQAEAVTSVTDQGASLASSAAAATAEADIDRLRFQGGAIDLDVVREFEGPLEEAAAALQDAAEAVDEVQSPWLVGPLADRVDAFEDEVDEALPDARIALQGVRLAPELLGGDQPRHYFLAFVTPAENRALGGFMGSFGELTAVDGDLELTRSGGVEDLHEPSDRNVATIDGPPDYLARYGGNEVTRFVGDVTLSPDMASVSEVLRQIYPQYGGPPVDGVISVDPVALQALLQFTGPITVDGLEQPLTSDNAAEILLREQYLTFDQRAVRKDFLADATRETFEVLTSGDIPGPRQVTEVLGPLVDQGRLMVHSFAADEQAFIEEVGLDGAFPRPEGGDLIGLVTQNAANNKFDIFMRRSLEYDVTYDPDTGQVEGTATIRITNEAPAAGLPDIIIGNPDRIDAPDGTNDVLLSFYTPLGLDAATVGSPLGQSPLNMSSEREFGMPVYTTRLRVPSGQTIELELQLAGTLEPSEQYRLTVANQPTVNPDDVTVTVRAAPGWRFDRGEGLELQDGTARATVPTTEGDQRLGAVLERD
jgi:hypothetical protein